MAAMESDGGQLQLASSKKKPMPLDALLIGSFPAPPTHIPLTPTSPNPPLSLPPSTPLPPVPGPSRISGHESLLLLSASRSRRSSRMSTASDHSRPPSTSSPPQSPSNTRPPAIAFSISEEPVDFLKDAGGIDDDDDEDALLNIAVPRQMPTPRKHQANESISDIDVRDILAAVVPDEPTDTEDILAGLPPKPTPRTPLPPRKFKHTLSLADPIDPHTIPPMSAALGGGGTIARSFTFPSSASPRRTVFHDDKGEKDRVPPRSPPSPDIGTIISKTPRPVLRSRVSSTASSTMGKNTPGKELRRRASEGLARTQSNKATRRRDPRVSDPTSTMMVRSTSELPYVTPYRSYGDSPYGIYGDGQLRGGDGDEDGDGPESDDDDTRSWIDHDEYGKPLVAPPRKRKTEEWGVGVGVEEARLESLERQLEGSESDGSDSSLDLHTPLPHLMLRHGLLSPRSKLIAVPPAGGRDSVASLASTTTMNTTTTTKGPLKDARDTEQRRARHKDGRLLRGGIGLTTGLGWSDSEDEDAPSALTRRISALTLSRRSSLASTASRSTSHISLSLSRKGSSASASAASTASRVHPLARSYSSGQLGEGYDNDDGDDDRERDGEGGVDEWGARSSRGSEDMMLSQSLSRATRVKTRARARTPTRWSSHSLPTASNGKMKNGAGAGAGVVGPGPPTAWTPGKATRIRRSGSGSTRTSVASSGSSVGGHGNGGGGVGGMMIPEGEEVEAVGQHGQGGMSMTPSPSTASTLSIPLPVTPQDCEAGLEEGHAAGGGGGGAQLKREKSLPPLPPALRRSPGSTNLGGLSAMQAMSKSTGPGGFAFPGAQQGSNNRPRTTSVSSAGSALRVRTNIGGSQEAPVRATVTAVGMNMKSTPAPTMMSTPRPLRLAQAPLLGPASTSTLPSPRMLPPPSSPLPRSQQGDRPAVPVPGVGYNNHNTLRSRSPLPPPGGSLPSTPSTPTTPVVPLGERPKPRTGTGMVYRSSAGSAPSRMRLPSSVVRPPPASAAVTTTTTVRPAVGVGIAL